MRLRGLIRVSDRIDKSELERIAALAKLDFWQGDEFKRNEQLINDMVGIVSKIAEIDISDVSITLDVKRNCALRDDSAKPSLSRADVLVNAGKNIEAGCISVPKLMEKGE